MPSLSSLAEVVEVGQLFGENLPMLSGSETSALIIGGASWVLFAGGLVLFFLAGLTALLARLGWVHTAQAPMRGLQLAASGCLAIAAIGMVLQFFT